MPEPYTTPYNVWQRLGRLGRHQTVVETLETGDVEQLQSHVITDKVVVRDSSGNEITDYEIDEDFNELTYTGADTVQDVTIKYMTAPIPNGRAKRGVEQAENHIDNHLNTTFGGLKRRTEEVYQTDGVRGTRVMLQQQPVNTVETVEINTEPAADSSANWKTLTEEEDWLQMGNMGFKLTNNVGSIANSMGYTTFHTEENALSRSPYQVRVTYTYGFEELPGDIQNLAEILLSTDHFIDTVFGAGVDGRDNFDPQTVNSYKRKVNTIKDEWERKFYDNFSTMVVPGDETDVQ